MPDTKRFNFQTGSWFRDTGPTDAVTLVIAGDWAPIRAFAPLIESNPQSIYGDILPVLQDADLTIVNLEAALSDIGSNVCKSGTVFKGKAQHVHHWQDLLTRVVQDKMGQSPTWAQDLARECSTIVHFFLKLNFYCSF